MRTLLAGFFSILRGRSLVKDIVVTKGMLDGLLTFMGKADHGIVSPAAREGLLSYDRMPTPLTLPDHAETPRGQSYMEPVW